jgi:hypothetical protein
VICTLVYLHVAQCLELQLLQEVELLEVTARLVPEKPNTEKMRAVWALPHLGQAGGEPMSLPRTNSSKVVPQSEHRYSKIGTVQLRS